MKPTFQPPAPDRINPEYMRSLDFDTVDDEQPPAPLPSPQPAALPPAVVTTAAPSNLLSVRLATLKKRDGFAVDLQALDFYADADTVMLLLPGNQTRVDFPIGTKLLITSQDRGEFRVVWSGGAGAFARMKPELRVLSFIRVADSV